MFMKIQNLSLQSLNSCSWIHIFLSLYAFLCLAQGHDTGTFSDDPTHIPSLMNQQNELDKHRFLTSQTMIDAQHGTNIEIANNCRISPFCSKVHMHLELKNADKKKKDQWPTSVLFKLKGNNCKATKILCTWRILADINIVFFLGIPASFIW